MLIAGSAAAQTAAPPAAPRMSLKTCTPMPFERHMHGCAVVGPRLYAFGGNREVGGKEDWLDSVVSAEILPAGDLGPWREERPLPDRRHYIGSSVEVVNNRIYVIAGSVAPKPDSNENDVDNTRDALWTQVQSDGTLGPWMRSEPFPGEPRACLATCSNDRYLFVTGGLILRTKMSDSVVRATLGPDGAPTDWIEVARLPRPLWFHGAAIMDEVMFVWGGLITNRLTDVNPDVFAAEVRQDGTLGPWRVVSKMPLPVYAAAFCGFNDHLVCIGGRYAGARESGGIWFTRLTGGVPGQWTLVDTDLNARIYLTLGLDKTRGWIFIPGGRFADKQTKTKGPILNTVQAFHIPQPPQTAFKTQAGAPVQTSTGGVTVYPLVEAIARAGQEKKPILVFFHSPAVPAARRVWEAVSATDEFKKISQNHIWAEVDISRESSNMVYEYGVFKVPAVVKLAPTGQRLGPAIPLAKVDDLLRLAGP
jgi:hypothetical protein